MSEELVWIYALNLIVNSFLTFCTIACIIHLLIFIFRVKQPRFKAILLTIPLIKLIIDPFLYDFQNWSLHHHLNPLDAEVGSRMLSAQLYFSTEPIPYFTAVQFSLNNGHTFTLGDIAALSIASFTLKLIITAVTTISFILVSIYLIRVYQSAKALIQITKNAKPCRRPIQNLILIRKMKQLNCHLITSDYIHTPCAFGIFSKRICFPSQLVDHLSQEEFEAIIAHEYHHLQWYDGIVRMLCQLSCTFFWWIPTNRWLNQMKNTQEAASDNITSRFNIARLDLASAIIETAKATQSSTLTLLATYFIKDSAILKRIQPLLVESIPHNKKWTWIQIIIIGLIAGSIVTGRFWIF